MVQITIMPCIEYYDWKSEVCDDFNNNVVIVENRYNGGCENAEWWILAKSLVDDIECYYNEDADAAFIKDSKSRYSYTTRLLLTVWDMYWEAVNIPYNKYDETEFIASVAETLNPGLELECGTIHGYSQGDWADVVYVKDNVDPKRLEAFYFNNCMSVYYEDDEHDFWDTITDYEYWDMGSGPRLEQSLRERYDVPEDEALKVVIED